MSLQDRIAKINQTMKEHKINARMLLKAIEDSGRTEKGSGCTNIYSWLKGKTNPSATGLFVLEETLNEMVKK